MDVYIEPRDNINIHINDKNPNMSANNIFKTRNMLHCSLENNNNNNNNNNNSHSDGSINNIHSDGNINNSHNNSHNNNNNNSHNEIVKGLDNLRKFAGIKTPFIDFQYLPIKWMIDKELSDQKKVGGILAYPMGLGKTFMTIAYCTISNYLLKNSLPTLIVCTKTLVDYWKSEILLHTNELSKVTDYNIAMYHGTNRKLYKSQDLQKMKFILTTYDIVRNELNRPNSELYKVIFARICLDEAHRIRTPHAQQTMAVMKLRSRCRWCVTGTPFNNRVTDLISLCQFINIEPYNQTYWWQNHDSYSKQHWRNNYLMIREKPEWMPVVTILDTVVTMSKEHAEFYENIQSMANIHYNEFCNSPANKRKNLFNGLLVWLLRLRQTAIHPLLMLHALHKRQYQNGIVNNINNNNNTINSNNNNNNNNNIGINNINFMGNEMIKPEPSPLCDDEFEDNLPEEKDCNFISKECNPFDVEKLCSTWKHGFCMTAKFQAIINIVNELLSADITCKIVMFSQWTSVLDLVEKVFETNLSFKYRYVRLDGSIFLSKDRNDLVNMFRKDSSLRVFISTTQAGGVGINLEMANKVIMFDTWFNPFAEDQAVDRVHRVTQKKPVDVYRLRVADTVEADVLRIQTNKRAKAKEWLGTLKQSMSGNNSQEVAMNSLSKEEVCSIFKRKEVSNTIIVVNNLNMHKRSRLSYENEKSVDDTNISNGNDVCNNEDDDDDDDNYNNNNNNNNNISKKNWRQHDNISALQFMQSIGLEQRNIRVNKKIKNY